MNIKQSAQELESVHSGPITGNRTWCDLSFCLLPVLELTRRPRESFVRNELPLRRINVQQWRHWYVLAFIVTSELSHGSVEVQEHIETKRLDGEAGLDIFDDALGCSDDILFACVGDFSKDRFDSTGRINVVGAYQCFKTSFTFNDRKPSTIATQKTILHFFFSFLLQSTFIAPIFLIATIKSATVATNHTLKDQEKVAINSQWLNSRALEGDVTDGAKPLGPLYMITVKLGAKKHTPHALRANASLRT
ncbi:hypothetical protein HYFRA_00009008 [Hymenoscyphus fraxineus]|uniref:Uncharacterized protein n=1 Tax=Hymenoscyphus fraxineus TaxID=746836 RepID=A0A9N9KSN4_9HELO|nr:hypothetical protein HYFRA_00009008 [Hymenoscyphus fraxineus]